MEKLKKEVKGIPMWFIVLLMVIATAIYSIYCYADFQRYESWKQSILQEHPEVAEWIDFKSYFAWNTFAYAGLVLLAALWICLVFGLVVRCRRG
ncbi:MAG: hypothetical protein QXR76_05655 [Candidatus Bathyarchaeia archaeon]